jgi:hypothetical protein
MRDTRVAAHIEFEGSRNHDDGLTLISILKQREPERFCSANEQATTTVLLVLNNPVAAAVLADKKEMRFRRGRFLLAHDTSPSVQLVGPVAASAFTIGTAVFCGRTG